MATVYVTTSGAMGGGAPVYAPIGQTAQKITSSGTSAQATFTAEGGEFLNVYSDGGTVAVAVGKNPTAVSGAAGSHFVGNGHSKDFGPLSPGDKLAIIDA